MKVLLILTLISSLWAQNQDSLPQTDSTEIFSESITTNSDTIFTKNYTLKDNGTFDLPSENYRIEAKVVDYKTDIPIKGAEVTITSASGESFQAKSNADGKLSYETPINGDLTLSLKRKEYKGFKTSGTLVGRTLHLHIKMSKTLDLEEMIFSILGGLGIFLLGMKFLSDGLQTIAGNKLRRLIGMVTDNRILATGVGLVVTMLVQSSSITTVMAVGFVNSGIMALKQAIGVILGANIGTTITGWILVLKVGKWGLPIIGLFAFLFIFAKKEKLKYLAFTFIGIGMVFLGLEFMKNGFKPIKGIPEFETWFSVFQATSYLGVLKCAAVGCILTMIVQSSSATLGITMGLAATGIISFETAAALVLGENIGTTITALLAAIGTTTNARRAAYFHFIFNIVGVLWITALFQAYLPIIRGIVGVDPNTMVMSNGSETYPYIQEGIALVHTIFNVVNTLFFLPIAGYVADFLMRVVKDEVNTSTNVTNLDFEMIASPFAAIEQSSHEISKMHTSNVKMMDALDECMKTSETNGKHADIITEGESRLDLVQKDITHFLTTLLSEHVALDIAESGSEHLRVADEYESISDYILTILKLLKRLQDNDLDLNSHHKEQLHILHEKVISCFEFAVLPEIKDGGTDPEALQKAVAKSKETGKLISHLIQDLRRENWKFASENKPAPLFVTVYSDILTCYKKIYGHLKNVVQAEAHE